MDHPADIERDIRGAGLRCTTQRVAVLEALRQGGGHQPVGAVIAEVRGRLGTVSAQGVYDALAALARHGLVRRLQPAGSPALYEAATRPHHHAVCRRCGAVEDVELGTDGPTPLGVEPAHGYTIDEVEVTFWGLCPRCQHATDEEDTT